MIPHQNLDVSTPSLEAIFVAVVVLLLTIVSKNALRYLRPEMVIFFIFRTPTYF